MNKVSLYSLVTVFTTLLVLCVTSCKGKMKPMEMPTPSVSVAQPEIRNIMLTKDYPGYLTSQQTVHLVARVNGYLQAVHFKPGSRVKQGELLFIIEPTRYENSVKQAKASLQSAQAQLEYTRSSYERMSEAIKSNAVSQIQLLQAQSDVESAEASLSNAQAALNTAQINLAYCYVKAPFTGTIDRNQFDVGNYIGGEGQPVTLATLYQDERMYIYFNIEDNQYMNMLMADSVNGKRSYTPREVMIKIGSSGTKQYPGKLDYLSPNIDLSTGTLNVRAELPNADGSLKSGLYVNITLPYAQKPKALLVQEASIGSDQVGKFLYVVSDKDTVRYRHIETGQLIGDSLREVISGIAPHEQYVTTALLKVRDGMKVKPLNK